MPNRIVPVKRLTLSQLDRALEPLRAQVLPGLPRGGWIRTIREALGMTGLQLAKRVGMTRQSLDDAERREAAGNITIGQLRRIAAHLDCQFHYALIPRRPLAETVDERAKAVAEREVQAVDRTMALEDQATDPGLVPERVAEVKQRLLAKRWSRLWD